MRVDVGRDRSLRERVRNVGPVPVCRGGRRVVAHQVDIPGECRLGLRAVDRELAALEPFAAELAEDGGIDVHVLPGAGDAAQRGAPDALVRRIQRGSVGDERLEVVGRLQALRVIQILAVDLNRDFAVVRYAVQFAVDAVGSAPGRDDVVEFEPVGIRQRFIGKIAVERLDPFVRGIERVVHRIGGVRRVGAGLRGEIDDALLPDLRGRNFLEADVDAGQRLELRRNGNQIFEIARRNNRDGDGFTRRLLPVDLGRLVRCQIGILRHRLAKNGWSDRDQS